MILSYKSMRRPGDGISLTHSNKDYLGVLHGVGPNAALLDEAMTRISAGLHWEIRP